MKTDRTPCKWEKALHSLTPGGSEFAGDLDRMVTWIKHARSSQHGQLVKAITRQRELEKANAKLLEALKAVVTDDGLLDLIDGIGEKPPFWDKALAAIAEAEAGAR